MKKKIVAYTVSGEPVTRDDAIASLKRDLNNAASAVTVNGRTYEAGEIVQALEPEVFENYLQAHVMARIAEGNWQAKED